MDCPPLQEHASDEEIAQWLSQCEPVQLFLKRARLSDPTWSFTQSEARVACDICQLLGGIPLAIELAAAYAPIVGVVRLREELTTRFTQILSSEQSSLRPTRHQSMDAALRYSLSNLSPQERQVFLSLCLFATHVSLETLTHVCEVKPIEPVLFALAQRSLITVQYMDEQVRYGVLPILRRLAFEQFLLLEPSAAEHWGDPMLEPTSLLKQEAIENRIAEYFANFVREWNKKIRGQEQMTAMHTLLRELEHLRWGMDWAEAHQKWDLVAGYASATWPLFLYYGLCEEGVERLRRGIRAAQRAGRQYQEATCLLGLSWMLQSTGDIQAALEASQNALKVTKTPQLSEELPAIALLRVAALKRDTGDVDESMALLDECENLFRTTQNDWGLMMTYEERARGYRQRGENEVARWWLEQAAAIAKRLNDYWSYARLLFELAELMEQAGDYARAYAFLSESITVTKRLGTPYWLVKRDYVALARNARRAGLWDNAKQLSGEGYEIAQRLGIEVPAPLLAEISRVAEHDQQWSVASALYTDACQIALKQSDEVTLAFCLSRLAMLHAAGDEQAQRRAAFAYLVARLLAQRNRVSIDSDVTEKMEAIIANLPANLRDELLHQSERANPADVIALLSLA